MNIQQLDKMARRRAGAKMGWYIHALVYVAVNFGLAALSAASGRNWAVFPALGWGIGLLVHGAVVFLVSSGWREQLVARERAALQARMTQQPGKDPW